MKTANPTPAPGESRHDFAVRASVEVRHPTPPTPAEQLRALMAAGLTAGEIRNILAEGVQETHAPIIDAARSEYADENLEIDDTPEVSQADEGCWVAAWVWVAADDPEPENFCPTCGGNIGDDEDHDCEEA